MPAMPFRAALLGLSTSSSAAVGQVSSYGYPFVPLSSLAGSLSSVSLGAYPTCFVDYMSRPTNIAVGVVSTNTYSVEYTYDYTGSSAFISSNATWFQTTLTSVSCTAQSINISAPVTAVRLNITAGSTQLASTFYVTQT